MPQTDCLEPFGAEKEPSLLPMRFHREVCCVSGDV